MEKNQSFSRKLFALLSDKLFKAKDLKSDLTLYEILTGECHGTGKGLSTNIFDVIKLKIR